MKRISLILVVLTAFSFYAGGQNKRQNPSFWPIKVKIEATELDRRTLLEKLNTNGASHKLSFILSEDDFNYRIVFGTEQGGYQTVYGEMNSSGSTVQVFDSKGTQLFAFNRVGRLTDSGATNAAAKEVIKRLQKLQ